MESKVATQKVLKLGFFRVFMNRVYIGSSELMEHGEIGIEIPDKLRKAFAENDRLRRVNWVGLPSEFEELRHLVVMSDGRYQRLKELGQVDDIIAEPIRPIINGQTIIIPDRILREELAFSIRGIRNNVAFYWSMPVHFEMWSEEAYIRYGKNLPTLDEMYSRVEIVGL